MNFTLNQLQVFIKITETLSITKASEELHLTQPAVSIQLKNFQNQFDIPLIEVVGKKVFVTSFGNEVAKSAKQILAETNNLLNKSLKFKGQLTGDVKLSIVSTAKYVMPYFLSGFVQANKGVEIKMDVTNKSSVVAALEKNEIDFALVSILPNKLQIEKVDLLQNKLYLVASKHMKLTKNNKANEFWQNLPLLFREQGSGTRQTMEAYFKKNGISVHPKMELTSNEAVKQAVIAGLGVSIMPLIGIKSELQSGELQIISIKGLPIKTTWSLIWLKGKMHQPVSEALLNHIKKEKNNIIKEMFSWYEDY